MVSDGLDAESRASADDETFRGTRCSEEEAGLLRERLVDLEVQAAKNAACFLVEELAQAGTFLDEQDG